MTMLKKIPLATASPILARYEPAPEVGEIVDPDAPPATALEALVAGGSLPDYASFLAHALPPREGICWATACLAAREVADARDARAIESAAAWVAEPVEQRRRASLDLADGLGTDCAAGWLALAVGWNGSGSIGPAGQPPVMPAPYLHAKALLGAVALAGGTDDKAQTRFLLRVHALGLDVARGGWPLVMRDRAA